MKKSIALFLLFFAVSFTANAQSDDAKREVAIQAKAKSDLKDLVTATDISGDNNLFTSIYKLFVTKHEQFAKIEITAEEKAAISKNIEEKLIGSLSAEQYKAIAEKPLLFKKLISE